MADEKLPKPDGISPKLPPGPIPRFSEDVVYAGAPPSATRPDAVVAGTPAAVPPTPPTRPDDTPKTALPPRSQINLFLGWLAGVFIILVCGWGLIAFCCYLDRRLYLNLSYPIAGGFGALVSLGLLLALEQNLWLSRFMGLRLGPHSTQVTETLFFFFTGIVGLLLRSSDAPAPAASRHHENDGTREIVETVVFVVVLVLMLKTFLVEAFVIPTGSMADTLLGYNRDYPCQKCGYRFVVNCHTEAEAPADLGRKETISGGVCPNCRYDNFNPPPLREP